MPERYLLFGGKQLTVSIDRRGVPYQGSRVCDLEVPGPDLSACRLPASLGCFLALGLAAVLPCAGEVGWHGADVGQCRHVAALNRQVAERSQLSRFLLGIPALRRAGTAAAISAAW